METKGQSNRRRIIDAANRLFYEHGFNQTSFADIAAAAAIPKGNFYYYFKSKDELLHAVVTARLAQIGAMLLQWESEIAEPRDRLLRYVDILVNEEESVKRYGCPMGTLIMELGKGQPALQTRARQMYELFADWLSRQFQGLGYGAGARAMALHLLARTQGIAAVSHAFGDVRFLREEAGALREWIMSQKPEPVRD